MIVAQRKIWLVQMSVWQSQPCAFYPTIARTMGPIWASPDGPVHLCWHRWCQIAGASNLDLWGKVYFFLSLDTIYHEHTNCCAAVCLDYFLIVLHNKRWEPSLGPKRISLKLNRSKIEQVKKRRSPKPVLKQTDIFLFFNGIILLMRSTCVLQCTLELVCLVPQVFFG